VVTSEFVPGSAGERFGSVVRARQVGDFQLRLSRYGPGLRMPVHHHPLAYFSFIARGGMDEWSEGREHRFESGSVHFHAPLEPHEGRVSPAGMTCLSIIPLAAMADRVLHQSGDTRTDARSPAMRWSAARCYDAFRCGDDLSWLSAEAAALELVAALLRERRSAAETRTPRWLGAVRAHLERRYAESIRLRDLAAIAGVHEVHLIRAFRRHVGATPGDYVRRLRVEAARDALIASCRPIAEIALATGFSSQAHLTRVFHREVGEPPAAFRRRHLRRGR
jgi:AraC family transcriptional regulator